jgi:hypothetical protein
MTCAALCGLALGCGGRGGGDLVKVKGRLTNAGQPLTVRGQDVGLGVIELGFYRMPDNGPQSTDPESARLEADGRFTVPGRNGQGISPGKYRIVVRQWDPFPDFDKLKGQFDAEHSSIVRTITGNEEVLIDVSKPEG